MHFTYAPVPNRVELFQGDVLARTSEIDALLQEVHPHFHQHSKNKFFMVLTQSCDLVRRQSGGGCKAPYIAIAPVRSLDLVIERHLTQQRISPLNTELPLIGQRARARSYEFLQRLFNNNEAGYFYLFSEGTDLDEDCVAFLNLSIAIKADLHLQKCIDAKVLQLEASFQAKLGWLVGQLYSRVGTDDWAADNLSRKINSILEAAAIWVDDKKLRDFEAKFSRSSDDRSGETISAVEINRAISGMPTLKQKVIDQATKVLSDVVDESALRKLRRRLESDAALTALLK